FLLRLANQQPTALTFAALSAKNLKSLPHWYSYTEVAKQTVGWCVVCVLGVMCAVAMMLVFF
ncbi:hypothetical protein HMPREF1584_00296, partial [Gardnerella vaginalis JCP8481A]